MSSAYLIDLEFVHHKHKGSVGTLMTVTDLALHSDTLYLPRIALNKRGCIQKFPDWPPGARTADGRALCSMCSCVAIL